MRQLTDQDSTANARPPIPKAVQREVWRRDQGKCVDCGSQINLEFDHIIPFAKGGSTTTRSIQLLVNLVIAGRAITFDNVASLGAVDLTTRCAAGRPM